MARIVILALALLSTSFLAATGGEKGGKVAPALQFKANAIDGKSVDLAKYQGKVVLIVNVASECGYTPQYKNLQALHAKHAKDAVVPKMADLRTLGDKLECLVADDLWPLPSYQEMLFIR